MDHTDIEEGGFDVLATTQLGGYAALMRMLRGGPAAAVTKPPAAPRPAPPMTADRIAAIGRKGRGQTSALLGGRKAPSANQSMIMRGAQAVAPGQAGTELGVAGVAGANAIQDALMRLLQ